MRTTDFLVVGGGILGLTTARSLLAQGAANIIILEKENDLGLHASGRNSGVLHAGLYYAPSSLKGRFCLAGAQQMKNYVTEKKLPFLPLGKVLVAANRHDVERLEALYLRAQANGVPIEKITPSELTMREPEAQTYQCALFSPSTAVIDPKSVLSALRQDLMASGKCQFLFSQMLLRVSSLEHLAYTSTDTIRYAHLINVAGLHADRIAQMMDVGRNYRLLPFRGSYMQVEPVFAERIRGLIYPIPDPALPFLGVHFTRSASGNVYVGPTAAPALGREHYAGLKSMNALDTRQILSSLSAMIWRNTNNLRRHVLDELKKQLPGGIYRAAKVLVPALQPHHLKPSQKVGIRAQLIRLKDMQFVQDFVIEKGPSSTHVLNAVSPGFTASFAFGAHIASEALMNHAG